MHRKSRLVRGTLEEKEGLDADGVEGERGLTWYRRGHRSRPVESHRDVVIVSQKDLVAFFVLIYMSDESVIDSLEMKESKRTPQLERRFIDPLRIAAPPDLLDHLVRQLLVRYRRQHGDDKGILAKVEFDLDRRRRSPSRWQSNGVHPRRIR